MSVGVADCDVSNCSRGAIRGIYCNAHYQRKRLGKDLDTPLRTWPVSAVNVDTCTHHGCSEPNYSAGMCKFHYHRRYMGRDMDAPRNHEPRVAGVSQRTTPQGYLHTWVPDHPSAFGPGYVMAHRYVMEQVLGRYLLPSESVHHLNGDRADNRPENLELWITTQPSGQRVIDRVADARNILALYGTLEERQQYSG